jgi:hypothetical protein
LLGRTLIDGFPPYSWGCHVAIQYIVVRSIWMLPPAAGLRESDAHGPDERGLKSLVVRVQLRAWYSAELARMLRAGASQPGSSRPLGIVSGSPEIRNQVNCL